MRYPSKIYNWIENKEVESLSREYIPKISPIDGKIISQVVRSKKEDIEKAVSIAEKQFTTWKNTPIIARADILRKASLLMLEKIDEIALIIHLETGKSLKDAKAECMGAIELGFFYAGEGRRYYGQITSSSMPNRVSYIIRQPVGICVLIVPFNTPIANVAWKSFPALLCGNTVVLKASSDTPNTALWFAKILKEANLPNGVFTVIQGKGKEAGQALTDDTRINLISFTGSSDTGRLIAKIASPRFVKLSLEMGGKNPFIVCDDADLEVAADFAVLSAFSNAGQRCASASRIIVFSDVYEKFKKIFLEKTRKLKIGSSDEDDLGPVINEKQMNNILTKLEEAKKQGVKILIGGKRLSNEKHKNGFYIEPTILENVKPQFNIYNCEIFGPVTSLHKVDNFKQALALANNSSYGLTSAIHTKNIDRIQEFIKNIESGVVSVNGPTHGSEPHLPFGGVKQSGNGYKEPGPQALDIYSNLKTVYVKHDPNNV